MLLFVSCLLVAQTPVTEVAQPARRVWLLTVEADASSTAAFAGAMALGAGAAVRRDLARRPFYVGGRLAWTRAAEPNSGWTLTHDHGWLGLVAGVAARIDTGRLFAEAGAGAALVLETRRRHQHERLGRVDMAEPAHRAYSLGPGGRLSAGATVDFYEGWSLLVAAGPSIAWWRVDGETAPRVGWDGQLGVGYAF